MYAIRTADGSWDVYSSTGVLLGENFDTAAEALASAK